MTTLNTSSSWDPVWETIFSTQAWGKYPSEHVIRFVARNFYKVAPRHSVRILDLGSGPGASTWFMAREGFSVSAIEGSKSAIEQCGSRLRNEGLTAELVVGDFTRRLPWADGYFDAVIDNATLCCNTPDACKATIGEVRRVLRPNGKFLSCNFTPRTWGFGTGRLIAPNTYTEVTEGPLAHKGTQFFMSLQQIGELYGAFSIREIETISYSMENRSKLVENWVIIATK